MTVSNYKTTASQNTAINGVNISEGMSPSDVNNAIRQELKDVRDVWNDKEWFLVGSGTSTVTYTRASATSVTINADVTSAYHVGRRIKITGTNTGTIYGKIATSSYSSPNTTVAFTFDSGTINASDSTCSVFVGSTYVGPSIPVIDEDSFSSNTAILPPSQQSTKAFIESGTTIFTNKRLNSPKINEDVVMSATSTELNLLDGATVTTAEINYNDTGASVGTVVASKTVTADANKDVASFRNITLTGELDAGSLDVSGNADIDGTLETDGLSLNGTTITATGAELNILDGVTSTTAELNILDGVTSTTAELNILDGVTSTTAELNILDGVTANKDEINILDGVTATTAELNILDGVTSTTAEINYTDGVTSNIQTQLNTKLTASSNLSDLASATTSRSNLGLGTIATQASNSISISGGAISGMGTPSNNTDVANKSYVDQAIAGLRNRTVAECASTANVNISNALEAGDAIDGVTLVAGDRVLLKNQSTATENGLYLAVASGAGTASRDPEHDTIAELSGGMITVNQGSSNDNKIFLCTTDNSGSVGSTNITYTQVTPSNTGTVESVGITQSGSEFTIGNTPITSTGNITLNVNRISATKIGANTNISDTEYGYLNGASSNIQDQLNAKATQGFAIALAVAL